MVGAAVVPGLLARHGAVESRLQVNEALLGELSAGGLGYIWSLAALGLLNRQGSVFPLLKRLGFGKSGGFIL